MGKLSKKFEWHFDEYNAMDLWPRTKKTDKKIRERIAYIGKKYRDSAESNFYHLLGLYAYDLSKWRKKDKEFMEMNFMRAYVQGGQESIGSAKYLCFVLYDCGKYNSLVSFYENDLKRVTSKKGKKLRSEPEILLIYGLYICSLIQKKKGSEKKILVELDRWTRRFDRYDNEGEVCDGAVPVDFLTQIRKLSNIAKVNEFIGKLTGHAWDL